MHAIDTIALALVTGGGDGDGDFSTAGPNRLEYRNLLGTRRMAFTDYTYCAKDIVEKRCNDENRRWWGGVDKGAAGKCVADRLVPLCGHPSGSGGS